MSDESKNPKVRLTLLLMLAAFLGFVVLAGVFNSRQPDGPRDPRGEVHGVYPRIHFGADKAVAIAIEEVKKREGWSGDPGWANVEQPAEATDWVITVRCKPRSPVGERVVTVSSRSGEVLSYRDPNTSR